MSHFSILVVTEEEPTQDHLHDVLLPWHEYECTGIEECLEWVDETEEVEQGWETGTEERAVRGKDMVSVYDQRFKNPKYDPLKFGPERQPSHLPPADFFGWEVKEIAIKDLYPSKKVYAEEAFGYKPIPGKPGRFGRKTNPNAKWDWWVIGGRWSGLLRAKEGAKVGIGRPGVMDTHFDKLGVDQVQVKDLDIEAMRQAHVNVRQRSFKEAVIRANKRRAKQGLPPFTEDEVIERNALHSEAIGKLRKLYEASDRTLGFAKWIDARKEEGMPEAILQRQIQGEGCDLSGWGGGIGIPEEETDVRAWIESAPALHAWGFVIDGEWHESGRMGWFGMSSDDVDPEVWQKKVEETILGLDGERWISVVDCHI